jgi:hypothetical protein
MRRWSLAGLAEVARATSRSGARATSGTSPSLPFFGRKLVQYFPIGVGSEFIGVSQKTVQDGCRALDIDESRRSSPSTAGYFGLMKYTQDFQDQQIQLLKEQRKKQNPAASPPHRSGNSG